MTSCPYGTVYHVTIIISWISCLPTALVLLMNCFFVYTQFTVGGVGGGGGGEEVGYKPKGVLFKPNKVF